MRRHLSAVLAAALWVLSVADPSSGAGDAPEEALTNPFLGDPQAISDGRRIYRSRCVICHARAGARGPDLFSSPVTDEQFLETVINGRKGTQMPAFGFRLSPDDVWQVHAYIKSTDHYE